jgi:peptide/nickel transport system substrate-binding protein
MRRNPRPQRSAAARRVATRWRAAAIVLLAVLAAVAFGCSSDDSSSPAPTTATASTAAPTTTTENPGPREGGRLSMAVFAVPSGLDPVVAAGGGATGGTEMAAIYDTLVRWNPSTATYEPRTATAVEPNADATEWTIRLRPDVTFSDGTPYDAAAVKAGLDRHRSPVNRTASAAQMTRVGDVVVVDPLTVVVSLTEAWPGFEAVLADEPGMIPSPTALAPCGETAPAQCAFATAPVGAGPFVLASFTPGEELVLKRNETFWGGRAHLDELRFVGLHDSGGQRTLAALDESQVDVAFLRDPATVVSARSAGRAGHPVLVEGGSVTLMNAGAWITCTGGQPAVHCAGRADGQFRTAPPTSVVDVRRAVALALEPNEIDREVTGGAGRARSTLLSTAFTGVRPVAGPTHDTAAAKALVDAVKASGWTGQLRYRCTNTPTNVARAQAMRSQLAAVGIDLVLDVDGGTDEQVQALVARDFDLACWGLQVTPDDLGADALRQNLYSTLGTNRGGYESPDMDAWLDALRVARDTPTKQAAYRRIAEIYAQDLPFYVDAAIEEYVAWSGDVVGITPTLGSVIAFDQAWLAR